jgi:hypothetical protein
LAISLQECGWKLEDLGLRPAARDVGMALCSVIRALPEWSRNELERELSERLERRETIALNDAREMGKMTAHENA